MATNPKKVYTFDILDMETPVPPIRSNTPSDGKEMDPDQNSEGSDGQEMQSDQKSEESEAKESSGSKNGDDEDKKDERPKLWKRVRNFFKFKWTKK